MKADTTLYRLLFFVVISDWWLVIRKKKKINILYFMRLF
jgi:hypothetical protein